MAARIRGLSDQVAPLVDRMNRTHLDASVLGRLSESARLHGAYVAVSELCRHSLSETSSALLAIADDVTASAESYELTEDANADSFRPGGGS